MSGPRQSSHDQTADGDLVGDLCSALLIYGPAAGERCLRPAFTGSRFCLHHVRLFPPKQRKQSADRDPEVPTELQDRNLPGLGRTVGSRFADTEDLTGLGNGDGGAAADVIKIHDDSMDPERRR